MEMHCLVVMLCRQTDDFLILSDDPVRVPKITVIINNAAIKSFLKVKTAMRTLPVSTNHELTASEIASRNCYSEHTPRGWPLTSGQEGSERFTPGARTGDKTLPGSSHTNSLTTLSKKLWGSTFHEPVELGTDWWWMFSQIISPNGNACKQSLL